MRAVISKSDASSDSMKILSGLKDVHTSLKEKVEVLYSSLNVHVSFPQLLGLDLDFVHLLLMARDLKINIRKCAIGSFFEWDKLDQAAGGREQAIGIASLRFEKTMLILILSGTKLHQATCKAISRHKPALMQAIHKFNSYCAQLDKMYKPKWGIPLPKALPTQLAAL